MASHLVGQNPITTFTTPVNGTSPINADQVRSNDNTTKAAYNLHDADATIHFQDSLASARPVAGTAGRKWLDNDTYRVYWDDGAAWHELAYAATGAGAFTAPVTITSTTSPQLTILYDGSNTLTVGVSSAGVVTFNATGASQSFVFSDPVTNSGTLTQTGVATFTAQPILSSLTASLPVFTDASKGLVSNAMTGTGSVVMSASPTLTGTAVLASATLTGTLTVTGATITGLTAASVGAGTFPTGAYVFNSGNVQLTAGDLVMSAGNITFSTNNSILGFASNHVKFNNSTDTVSIGTSAGTARLSIVGATAVFNSIPVSGITTLATSGTITVTKATGGTGVALVSGNTTGVIQSFATSAGTVGYIGSADQVFGGAATNLALQSNSTVLNLGTSAGVGMTFTSFAVAFAGAVSGITTLAGTGAVSGFTTASLAGPITLTTAASKIIPGATSLSHRNNADNADNILIADAGGVTFRAGLSGITTLSMSGALTYGGVTLSAAVTGTGNMVLSTAPTFTGTITIAGMTSSVSATWNGTFSALSALSVSPTLTATAGAANALLFGGTLKAGANSDWLRCVYCNPTVNPNSMSTVSYAGVYVATPSATGTPDKAYGIYLETITGGTTNFAIFAAGGDVVLAGSGSALATGATTGFPFIPTCAGTPTGVPAGGGTGRAAMIYDTTANKIWFYNGSWRGVVVA